MDSRHRLLVEESDGEKSLEMMPIESCMELFKTSFHSTGTGEDLKEEMKKHGIDVGLIPGNKKVKDMTNKELEDYENLINQIEKALDKFQEQLKDTDRKIAQRQSSVSKLPV
mmetsp:Transcript_16497/g.29615  ORF Transcript_16497/g.29615 Transcript_16497/m.29615 type:complete len:112 (+) Transcript_16497:50-385(+)